jgi:hypothetical protein
MKHSTTGRGPAGTAATHRGMRRSLAIVVTASLALLLAGFGTAPESARAAPYGHCNSLFNTPGLGMDCSIVVVNNLDLATGVTSSTTTYTRCSGAANTALSCEGPTTVSSTDLVTSIAQCNSSLGGGGASMHCSVLITNNIVGDATAIGATVNQCNGSLGGGTIVLRACGPDPASTGGASIDQCNNSVNGGGSSLTCTVLAGATTSAALNVTVSQCNYSANDGGSLVVCSVAMATYVTPAAVVPPVEEEEEVGEEGEETPPTEVETPPADTERVIPETSVNPFGAAAPQVLANTGGLPLPPTGALLLTNAGLLLVGLGGIMRRRQVVG